MQEATCAEETRDAALTALPRSVRWAWSAALLAAVGGVFAIAVAGGHAFISDDIYFYLRIADSIARGEGSSFNGVIPTNGFHPLWELVCVLERLVVGDRNHTLLRVHLAVSGCVTALSALTLARFPRGSRTYLPIAALLTTLYVTRSAMGSEQHLSLLLMAWLIFRYRQPEAGAGNEHSATSHWGWGVLLGLALLARLDNVFALAGLFTGYLLRDRHSPQWTRRLFATCAAAALVLTPYFAWNVLQFGHLEPISGAVKSGLAAGLPMRVDKFGAFGGLLALLSFALVALLVYLKDWQRRDTMLWFGAGACIHSIYIFLRIDAIWTWYFSTQLLFVAITLGELFDRWSSQNTHARQAPYIAIATAAAAACMFAFIANKTWKHAHADTRTAWYIDAGQWFSENLPRNAIIATACTPGAIGYYTRQPVIAFDGLTNDFKFQQNLIDKGLVPTLEALGVTHIISFGPEGEQLNRYTEQTKRIGHGGAGGAFYGKTMPDGTIRATAVGLYSPFSHEITGRYELTDQDLVGQNFCHLDLAVWRFDARR